MADLKKHMPLFAVLIGLQMALALVLTLAWLQAPPRLSDSWLGGIADNLSGPLLIYWTSMAALVLMGVGGYWSVEINDGFNLEAWRYPSFSAWLFRRLCFGVLIGMLVLCAGLLPLLGSLYRGEMALAIGVVVLLSLYCACLSLALMVATLLGIKTAHALAAMLLFHTANVIFDGLNLPNAIRLFLVGEGGSGITALVTGSLIALVVWATSATASSTAISTRGSEYQ